MRAGTSKGVFFSADDLPKNSGLREKVLLAVMGSPDVRQIDGLGGADPLTSKVAIVSRSSKPGIDVDYLFAQVSIDKPIVDMTPNCGNILAGVGSFAIERGLVMPTAPKTTVTIHMVNTGNIAVAHIPTPNGTINFEGDTAIAGVPKTAAAIQIDFQDTAGSVCDSLLPTGNVLDDIDGCKATLIDNGMPVVVLRAMDFGKSGYESPAELDNDKNFKSRLEQVRIIAGNRMGLGDVTSKVIPKMTLIAPPRHGGNISTRTFIPHKCHSAIGVLGAVTVATVCVLPGSVTENIAIIPDGATKRLSVEHPTGEFTVEIEISDEDSKFEIVRSSLVRTARTLFTGHTFVPKSVWDGNLR